ncbi:MAG: hypothetical protein WC279_14045 [Sulfurimonas sp.]|jgi:hypothetical protein|uniref:hypothetical protein n=1 Tax=Sulfurimonas sp. TaxID=2022749 RepID=UPI003562B5AA
MIDIRKGTAVVYYHCDKYESRSSYRLKGVFTSGEILEAHVIADILEGNITITEGRHVDEFTDIKELNDALTYAHVKEVLLNEGY